VSARSSFQHGQVPARVSGFDARQLTTTVAPLETACWSTPTAWEEEIQW
jgi:hypothetical protein